MEILKATNGRPLDAIFVCVGGGGLISGIAAYVKAVRPSVKVSKSVSCFRLDTHPSDLTALYLLGNWSGGRGCSRHDGLIEGGTCSDA